MIPEFANWPFKNQTTAMLLESASQARLLAHAPYSHFRVGAAVLTETGQVVCGCNIENASFGLTVCAERVALFSALSSDSGTPVAIAITGEEGSSCVPCGACLQVMAEFNDELLIVLESQGPPLVYRLKDLLPLRFKFEGKKP